MSTDSQVRYFNKYICGMLGTESLYDFSNKNSCNNQHVTYMLSRTQSMFTWSGLPDTIPQRILELYLQTNGNVCFYIHNDNLYVFVGGMGGAPDAYYMPTLYTIANPALNLSKSLKIDKECIVMSNDSLYIGLVPMFQRYANMLTENELSLYIALINSRLVELISAPDDRTKASAEKYLEDIKNGKMGVIAENAFLDGIKTHNYSSASFSNMLKNLIEIEQYIKASWYNELGLNANFNMKRESLNSAESALNDDILLPLIDDMLKCRKIGCKKINAMYGTNINVKLASSWEDNQQEIVLEHKKLEGEN